MNARQFCQTLAASAVLVTTLGTAACAGVGGRLYVRVAPPRPVVEAVMVSPGPGYVWVPGYQRWEGNGYVWMPGVWRRPPRPRAVWVPGHWAQERRRGWFFVEGHWR